MRLVIRNIVHFVLAFALMCVAAASFAKAKDPTTNPEAVSHQIDRSAMTVQIQGWTRDLKYPIYPIAVHAGQTGAWYDTNSDDVEYTTFNVQTLRCEIGFADKSVLTNKKYHCGDGVCGDNEGNVVGVDPRLKLKACR